MNRHSVWILAALSGALLGFVASHSLMAQKPPAAFYIAEVDITSPDEFSKYAAAVPATVAKYGGRHLVRGGKTEAIEGDSPKRIVVTAFPSMADARKWYDSPEYSAIRPIRLRSAKTRAFIVEELTQ